MAKTLKKRKNTEVSRVAIPVFEDGIPDAYKINGLPVWELQPNECPVNFFYFQIYKDLGPNRTLMQAKLVGLRVSEYEKNNWKKYSTKDHRKFSRLLGNYTFSNFVAKTWAWESRAKLWDQYIEWKCRFLAENPIQARLEELKAIHEIRFKAIQKLRETPLHKLSVQNAMMLLEITHRHERVLRGKPTHIFEDLTGNGADEDNDENNPQEIDWNKVPVELLEQIVEHGTGKKSKPNPDIDVKAVVVPYKNKVNGHTNGNGKHKH